MSFQSNAFKGSWNRDVPHQRQEDLPEYMDGNYFNEYRSKLGGNRKKPKKKKKSKAKHTRSDVDVARSAIFDMEKVITYLNNHFNAHALQGKAGKFALKLHPIHNGKKAPVDKPGHLRTETQDQSKARRKHDQSVYDEHMTAGKAAQKAEHERWKNLDPAAKQREMAEKEAKFHADHPDWTPEQWAERTRKYAERQEKIRENKLKRQARIEERRARIEGGRAERLRKRYEEIEA